MERVLGVVEARQDFSNIIAQVQHQGQAYIISRYGRPVAAVVPVEVYERWKEDREALFRVIRGIQQANSNAEPEQVMQDVLAAQQAVRHG